MMSGRVMILQMTWAVVVAIRSRRWCCECSRRRNWLPTAVELGLHEERLFTRTFVFAKINFIAIRWQFIAFAINTVIEPVATHRAHHRSLRNALRCTSVVFAVWLMLLCKRRIRRSVEIVHQLFHFVLDDVHFQLIVWHSSDTIAILVELMLQMMISISDWNSTVVNEVVIVNAIRRWVRVFSKLTSNKGRRSISTERVIVGRVAVFERRTSGHFGVVGHV